MEEKLKQLFDFQKFVQHPKLAELIAETEARTQAALTDESLEQVAAAGNIAERPIREEGPSPLGQ